MKTNRITFEMEIDVSIENPEAVKAYFIEGDWKNYFWDLEDLGEFCKDLAYGFQADSGHYDPERGCRAVSIEGFGTYYRDGQDWRLDEEAARHIGSNISIRYEQEIEAVFCTEQ